MKTGVSPSWWISLPFYLRLRAVCGPSFVLGPHPFYVYVAYVTRVTISARRFRKMKIDDEKKEKSTSPYRCVVRFKRCDVSIKLDWNVGRDGQVSWRFRAFFSSRIREIGPYDSPDFPGNEGWSGWPLLLLKGRLISLKFPKVEARWDLVSRSLSGENISFRLDVAIPSALAPNVSSTGHYQFFSEYLLPI